MKVKLDQIWFGGGSDPVDVEAAKRLGRGSGRVHLYGAGTPGEALLLHTEGGSSMKDACVGAHGTARQGVR